MMGIRKAIIIVGLYGLLPLFNRPALVQAQPSSPVVRAVLFYSPTCGHCHYVITEVLPALFDKYGNQLQMAGIDVSLPEGQDIFLAALQIIGLESGGVPFLVVGDTYLVGSVDIPEKFPGLIEDLMARGGVDWPPIPGLVEQITASQNPQGAQINDSLSSSMPGPDTSNTETDITASDQDDTGSSNAIALESEQETSMRMRLAQDPIGNGLSVVVLVGMIVSMGWGAWSFQKKPARNATGTICRIFPLLSIIGLGIAFYLARVETAQLQAVCGPVGDCNTVQQSEYARLFGILPIGVLGIVGYITILIAWGFTHSSSKRTAQVSRLAILVLTTSGTIFSIYLTFLEPFVIGATCLWCLSSAIIMTILMLFSVAPAKLAASRILRRDQRSLFYSKVK
jgi:uncharacterized membrane protein